MYTVTRMVHDKRAKTNCSSSEAQLSRLAGGGLSMHVHRLDMYKAYHGKSADELNQENDKTSEGCSVHHKHSNLGHIQNSLAYSTMYQGSAFALALTR